MNYGGAYLVFSKDGSKAFRMTDDARFINHAAKPNAVLWEDGVTALRRIKAGEEITLDYDGCGAEWPT